MARPASPTVQLGEDAQIRPTMDVRDDYVRPEAPQPSPLWRTAEALKEISGPLASMFDGFQKGNDAAQKDKAEADFWQGNSAGAGEAVRSGAIPAFASPIYTKTTQDLQSASFGIKLDGQIGQAYQESDIKTSQDPQAYDKWFAGTVKKLTEGQPNFMFGKANIEGIHSKYAQKWLADRNQATVNNQLAAGTALAGSTIDEFRNNAVANGGTVDVKNLGDAMTTLRTKLYDAGMEKSQVDKVITDTITSKATDYAYDNDGAVSAQILSTLDNTAEAPSGKAGALVGKQAIPLGQTPYGMIQKQATTAAVQRLIHQREEQAHTKLERENKADHDEGLRAITQSLAKDPNANIPEPVIAKVERYDPDFRKNLIQLRNTFLDAGVKEDPEKVASVYRDIVNGGGLATVRKALAPDGAIKKPATMSAAMTFAESVDKNLSSDAPVTRMSTYSKTIEQIEARTKTSGPGALFDTKGITDAGRAAENDFKVAAMKWATTVPPETPPEERERQLQAIAETYINQVGENTYTAPAGAPQGNPTQVKPQETTAAPVGKSKSDLADEAEAQRLRIPVQQYKQMLQDRINKLRQGTSGTSPSPDAAPASPAEAPPAAVTPVAPSGAAPTAPPPGAPVTPLGKRSDINIPGLGSMSFAGLDDEQMGHIKATLASLPGLNFTPEALNRQAQAAAPEGPQPVKVNAAKPGAFWGNPDSKDFQQNYLAPVTLANGTQAEVHKEAAPAFQAFLSELEARGYKVNSLGGFNNRNIAGSGTKSQHAFGNAIDINPDANPVTRDGKNVTDLPPDIKQMAAKYGLSWGGDWKGAKRDPMHFEWNGETMSPSKMAGGGGASPQNVGTAMSFFQKKGLSKEDAAAFVWNLTQESGPGLDSKMIHDGGTGMGIAGFRDTSPGSGRKSDLLAFAKQNGMDPHSLNTQLEFTWHELQGPEKRALQAVLAAKTPEQKAQAAIGYFRPYKPYAQDRASRAAEVRKLLGGGGQDV